MENDRLDEFGEEELEGGADAVLGALGDDEAEGDGLFDPPIEIEEEDQ